VVSVGRPMVGYWAGVSLAELLCWQSQRPGHGPARNATHALGYVRMRPLLHDDAPMPPQLCIKKSWDLPLLLLPGLTVLLTRLNCGLLCMGCWSNFHSVSLTCCIPPAGFATNTLCAQNSLSMEIGCYAADSIMTFILCSRVNNSTCSTGCFADCASHKCKATLETGYCSVTLSNACVIDSEAVPACQVLKRAPSGLQGHLCKPWIGFRRRTKTRGAC
jgi:hypothetical protein